MYMYVKKKRGGLSTLVIIFHRGSYYRKLIKKKNTRYPTYTKRLRRFRTTNKID